MRKKLVSTRRSTLNCPEAGEESLNLVQFQMLAARYKKQVYEAYYPLIYPREDGLSSVLKKDSIESQLY